MDTFITNKRRIEDNSVKNSNSINSTKKNLKLFVSMLTII